MIYPIIIPSLQWFWSMFSVIFCVALSQHFWVIFHVAWLALNKLRPHWMFSRFMGYFRTYKNTVLHPGHQTGSRSFPRGLKTQTVRDVTEAAGRRTPRACSAFPLTQFEKRHGQKGAEVTCHVSLAAVWSSVRGSCCGRLLRRSSGGWFSRRAGHASLAEGELRQNAQQCPLQLLLQSVKASVHMLLQPPLHLLQTMLHGWVQFPEGWRCKEVRLRLKWGMSSWAKIAEHWFSPLIKLHQYTWGICLFLALGKREKQ